MQCWASVACSNKPLIMTSRDFFPHSPKATLFRWFLTKALNCHKVTPKKRLSPPSSSSMLTSYGSFVIEDTLGEITVQESLIVVQAHSVGASEVFLFGIFEEHTADAATKYMKSLLFDKNLNETMFWKEAREALKIICSSINAKIQEKGFGVGSAAVVVLNSERLLAVNVGDYRAVLCNRGLATEICQKRQCTCKMFPSFNGLTGNKTGTRSSEPFVATERIASQMEFIILATAGVWEAMRDQEVVDLIRRIEDADEAAQRIVKEALSRGSGGSISCLVIRLN